MIKLQDLGGCHNINVVTPEHVVPQVALAIIEARDMGLRVPIVYNTGGYDALEAIDLMDGLVDIYLVDFKACPSPDFSDHRYGKKTRPPDSSKPETIPSTPAKELKQCTNESAILSSPKTV